jgi:hypothetical protein
MVHGIEELITDAMSDFTYQNPGALEKIKEEFPTAQSIDPESPTIKLYNKAAQAIVEPELHRPELRENEEIDKILEDYSERCERNGMQWLKGTLSSIDKPTLWHHIIDLVDENGY